MNSKPTKRVIAIFVVIMTLVNACGIVPVIGSGNLVTDTRQVSGFDKIEVRGDGDLVIIQDGTESITIETDDNLMQYVVANVQDGTLELRLDRNGMDNFRPTRLIFTVHVKELTGIAASGTWDIASEKIETGDLNITISGIGGVNIDRLTAKNLIVTFNGTCAIDATGQVTSQSITLSGTNAYRAKDLQSETTAIHISGTGDAILWVTDSLTVSLSSAGTVQYYGNPQTKIESSGAGSVQRLGDK